VRARARARARVRAGGPAGPAGRPGGQAYRRACMRTGERACERTGVRAGRSAGRHAFEGLCVHGWACAPGLEGRVHLEASKLMPAWSRLEGHFKQLGDACIATHDLLEDCADP